VNVPRVFNKLRLSSHILAETQKKSKTYTYSLRWPSQMLQVFLGGWGTGFPARIATKEKPHNHEQAQSYAAENHISQENTHQSPLLCLCD